MPQCTLGNGCWLGVTPAKVTPSQLSWMCGSNLGTYFTDYDYIYNDPLWVVGSAPYTEDNYLTTLNNYDLVAINGIYLTNIQSYTCEVRCTSSSGGYGYK